MLGSAVRRRRRRAAGLLATVAGAAALAGCTTHQVPPLSAAAIEAARTFKEFTVYWAGPAIGNAKVTEADSPLYFYAPVGFTMYYGNCEPRTGLHDGGCTLPLKVTTSIYSPHSDASFGSQRWVQFHGVPAVIYHGGDDIELYTDRMNVDIVADSPQRAVTAAEALRPFNRGASADFPAFPEPYYTVNPTQALLDAQAEAAATGSTSATGATSSIGPPSELEPTPSANGS
jgi:hypothetical protein